MDYQYKKHPKYIGKSLTIQRGRRDKLVGDHEILKGREWEKFVAQGLLVPVTEKPKKEKKQLPPQPPTPKVESKPKEEPKPDPKEEPKEELKEESKKEEESVSKSPASKVSGVGGGRSRSIKKVSKR